MQIKHLKLGTQVRETAADMKGMLTMFELRPDKHIFYFMQPRGTNPKTGEMVDGFWTTPAHIEGAAETESDLPFEVLGTTVTDEASGFSGTAVYLNQHISGCVHIGIQPAGRQENGNKIKTENVDIRRCSGPAIKVLTPSERAEDQRRKPSPSGRAYRSPMDS